MENPNLRNLVIYGKPQEELVEALKNLPNGRSVLLAKVSLLSWNTAIHQST